MEIEISEWLDRHAHFRQGQLMRNVLEYTTRQSWGSIVMPNLPEPITTWKKARNYRKEIFGEIKKQRLRNDFIPIMTAYLTDNTDPQDIKEGFENYSWRAVKMYPYGATTNSDKGVTKLEKIFPVLEIMEKIKMPFLIHPETDNSRREIMLEDRERVFTNETLPLIHKMFPELIISVEHITTREACQFVESTPDNVVGTVTPHHIIYNHNALFDGGEPPYKLGMYVDNMNLPILKWQEDVDYIKQAIMFGQKKYKFGAGSDTAPHTQEAKHSHGSCCGIFNAPDSIGHYAMAFGETLENKNGVSIFENFMSVNNLWIYGLEPSSEYIKLVKKDKEIMDKIPIDLTPFRAGQIIPWQVV